MSYFGAVIGALIAFAIPLATPASAEPAMLSDRYEAMGTIDAQLGEATYRLIVPYDIVRNRPHAEQRMIFGSILTISILGHVFGQDGTPDRPMLQITLQNRQGEMALISAEILDGAGYDAPLVMGSDGGQGDLVSFTLEDNVLSGTIEGNFLRVSGHAPDRSVAEGAEPLPATLELAVTLPPLE